MTGWSVLHSQQPLGLLVAVVLTAVAGAARSDTPYSPYTGRDYPTNVYWGDTHLHTTNSPDAWTMGNRILTPDEAYRFARGAEVTTQSGARLRLRRPLDFLVVADHGEYLGLFPSLQAERPELLATETGRRWLEMVRTEEDGTQNVFAEFIEVLQTGASFRGVELARSVWDEVTATADRHNDPGRFTAFIGYEWTSMPGNANLHRIVIFKNDASSAGQVLPFSTIDGARPEDLWRFMANYEEMTGGEVLAIPHNSNMSAGRMFAVEDSDGKPMSRAYAETRVRWEPLVEATQVKGDSETHPVVSPNDEFADYESWTATGGFGAEPHEDWMFRHEYVRPALGLGLELEEELGVNPYKFGLIGSTDSHTGLATADENDFWGKFSLGEPRPGRATSGWAGAGSDGWRLASSGYAAVWATENARESLFRAMQRKETYATTGPRMTVRFFGGWDYHPEDALAPDLAAVGYRGGVPMGGDLSEAPRGTSPSFLIRAIRDPDGAALDRVQVIKGWVDREGKAQERIYDVAVSDGRTIGADGRCKEPVGTTVDVAKASYTNAIGAAELSAVWRDPDFDARERAFYYVRVLEIPTPRWTTYDASRFGDELPPDIPLTTQERAYTSSIWYSPPGR